MLFLQFEVAGQPYALDTATVVEVLPLVEWRALPGVPASVLGVFNYHGTLVPLVDLAQLAFASATAMPPETRIGVVKYPASNGEPRLLGILLVNATLLRRDESEFVGAPIRSDAPYAGDVAAGPDGMIQRIALDELVSADVWDALAMQETGDVH